MRAQRTDRLTAAGTARPQTIVISRSHDPISLDSAGSRNKYWSTGHGIGERFGILE